MATRIVVIGGGYAGIAALGELNNLEDVTLTLIDPGEGHELIPELPEALRLHNPIEEHIVPYKEIFKGTKVHHVKDRVVNLDVGDRQVMLKSGETLPYDWLLLSPGSASSYPPIEGLSEHALPLRNAHDAFRIKEQLKMHTKQRIVVVGGGLTGTEVAGVLADGHDVWLIEGMSRLLPALGGGLARYARKRLETAGVKVMLGQKLVRVHESTLQLEHDRIHYDVLIWAGGIQPPRWLRDTKLPLDDQGYPKVSAKGQVLERVFAAGDVWRVRVDGEEVPQTAQLATMAGHYVGDAMKKAIAGDRLPQAFRPKLRGMLISLDPGIGVGWVIRGGIPVRGNSARALKNLSFQQYRLKLSRTFGRGWPF